MSQFKRIFKYLASSALVFVALSVTFADEVRTHEAPTCFQNTSTATILDLKPFSYSEGEYSSVFTGIHSETRQKVFVKVPNARSIGDIEYLAQIARQSTQALGDLAPEFLGVFTLDTEGFLPGAPIRQALVFEFVEGRFSNYPGAATYMTKDSFVQMEVAVDRLFANGLLPLDFQFFVLPDGSIKVVDFDFYLDTKNPPIEVVISIEKPLLSFINRNPRNHAQFKLEKGLSPALVSKNLSNYISLIVGGLENKIYHRIEELLKETGYYDLSQRR